MDPLRSQPTGLTKPRPLLNWTELNCVEVNIINVSQCFNILIRLCNPSRIRNIKIERSKQLYHNNTLPLFSLCRNYCSDVTSIDREGFSFLIIIIIKSLTLGSMPVGVWRLICYLSPLQSIFSSVAQLLKACSAPMYDIINPLSLWSSYFILSVHNTKNQPLLSHKLTCCLLYTSPSPRD